MTPTEVRDQLERLGLSQTSAAGVIDVDPRTVRGWCADPQRSPVPPHVKVLLRLMEKCPNAWCKPAGRTKRDA